MAGVLAGARNVVEAIDTHRRIIWALLMRELATRYGRNDLGFLWVLAEPIIFACAVSVLWSHLRAPFESGIRVIPFTVTGYMPLIMVRQTVGFIVSGVKVNNALLYHRHVTPLHIFIGRFGVEFVGVSLAYIIIVIIFNFLGLMPLPKDPLPLIGGWFLLAWMALGLALIVGALAEIYEFVERFVQITTYILVPLSGSFYMVSSLPPAFRHLILYVPVIHCFELMRSAYFGEFVIAYYSVPYAASWAAGLTLAGLLLVQFVRGRVEVH